MPSPDVEEFIARWSPSGGGERSNYQLFLSELCDLLGVPKPDPAVPDDAKNAYVFDRSIPRQEADGSITTNFIDLYKRGCFICETKQGVEATRVAAVYDRRSKVDVTDAHRAPLQKRGHGIRGSGTWDTAMEKARNQAEQYARSLPASEGRPPFLLIVDVGYSIELFAEFTCTGGTYVRFPDPRAHRIFLADLRDEKKRERLKQIWTDPHSLDPAKRSAKVTREIAAQLAKLARSFEAEGRDSQTVAEFLMRCIFTMFAEDVRLLPANAFKQLLESLKSNLRGFPVMVEALWKDMANGSQFSTVIREKVLHFNGGLFESATALSVTAEQLDLLIAAAKADWRDVEPAIFGTLLERALSPQERHKLGAHYTPRAYVERLVFPTVIDPLRVEWETVKTAAATLTADADASELKAEELEEISAAIVKSGDAKAAKTHGRDIAKLKKAAAGLREEAVEEVRKFHHALCKTRVLDPACGSGNFLYVTMEHMKRLEGEALELLTELGDPQLETEMREFKVRPHQFIGLEINPWAVPIAELVLWIGYLQWHFRTSDKAVPDDPVISKEHSIRKQDAVLAYDKKEMITWAMARENPDLPGLPDEVREKLRSSRGDEAQTSGSSGIDQSLLTSAATRPITVWDGRTMKKHPVTGKDVPDETARVPLWHYVNPRKAEWPEADYIVGNPPFMGNKRMRIGLSDSYVRALRSVWKKAKPDSWDFVMYWWHHAAETVRNGKALRFGFITTNSIHQSSNRSAIASAFEGKKPLRLAYAIPDHPWVDSTDGAAVRIAMTAADLMTEPGVLQRVVEEDEQPNGEHHVVLDSRIGTIGIDFTIGASATTTCALLANEGICFQGMNLVGEGFRVGAEVIESMGYDLENLPPSIRAYQKGRELLQGGDSGWVLDCFGIAEEDLAKTYPAIFQHLLIHVKPERDHNNRKAYRDRWWIFGEPRGQRRPALEGLQRYIATVETSKYKPFVFIDAARVPDHKLYVIASDDAWLLGCLSAKPHRLWALAAGGRLEDRPTWTNTTTFKPFPFPDPDEATRERIRELGEQLDAHRKRQQALHPGLTLTGMYNVLEKLRAFDGARLCAEHQSQPPRTAKGSDSSSAPMADASAAAGPADTAALPGLTAKEKEIHEQGLVSVLKQIHDDLDAAVFHAYGFPPDLTDEEILERLVALNHERAEEEKRGHIRWLRPEFQCPEESRKQPVQSEMISDEEPENNSKGQMSKSEKGGAKLAWPRTLSEQVNAVHRVLGESGSPISADELAKEFQRANKERIAEILETLTALGKARATEDGKFQR